MIKMDLKGVGWEALDWVHLDQDSTQLWPLMNPVLTLKVLEKVWNC
jgi:hypothetical protein